MGGRGAASYCPSSLTRLKYIFKPITPIYLHSYTLLSTTNIKSFGVGGKKKELKLNTILDMITDISIATESRTDTQKIDNLRHKCRRAGITSSHIIQLWHQILCQTLKWLSHIKLHRKKLIAQTHYTLILYSGPTYCITSCSKITRQKYFYFFPWILKTLDK